MDTDTESSDIENEQSQYPYFLSPSHDFDTSVHDDREKAAIEGFECKCKLATHHAVSQYQLDLL